MDVDGIIVIAICIIGIVLAIKFWPITLIIIGIYAFYRYKKKQAYKDRDARIYSLQSEVSRINEEIEKTDRRKIEICQTVSDIQSELSQLRDGLSDMQRFQRFILAFTHNDEEYAFPKSLDALTSQITSKKGLISKLESENKSNDSTASRLKSSLDSKTREISSLQEQQAASKQKK